MKGIWAAALMPFTEDLVRYINHSLLQEGDDPIGPDDALIDRGLLDSMAVMMIMTFVEERTGVRVPDKDVTPVNFESVSSIDDMVRRLRGG